MCGGCGADSARSAARHWSSPFLASVPARSAAARNLTRWSRAAGWSGTVSGVAGGFEVATASGRRFLASDLAVVLGQLGAYGVSLGRLMPRPSGDVVEGPPTWPGLRPFGNGAGVAPWLACACASPGWTRRVLPPDPRRRYRVPALLGWLAVAELAEAVEPFSLHLAVGDSAGLVVTSDVDGIVSCHAVRAPNPDFLVLPDVSATADLVALLFLGPPHRG